MNVVVSSAPMHASAIGILTTVMRTGNRLPEPTGSLSALVPRRMSEHAA